MFGLAAAVPGGCGGVGGRRPPARRTVAGLYAASLQGKLLSAELIQDATGAHSAGVDAVLGDDNCWGLAFVEATASASVGSGEPGGEHSDNYAFGCVIGSRGSHSLAVHLEKALRLHIGLRRSRAEQDTRRP